MEKLKLIGQVCAVIGIVLLFFDNLFEPHCLLLQSSPSKPTWLSWAIWCITAFGTISYIGAEYLTTKKQISQKTKND